MKRNWKILLPLFCTIGCSQPESSTNCLIVPDDPYYGHKDAYGYVAYSDIEKAKYCSGETGKPILILFTGIACLADTDMPWDILQDTEIKKIIDDNFIFTALYVDDKRKLSPAETNEHINNGKTISTIGIKNLAFQIEYFNFSGQPQYLLVDEEMNLLTDPINGYIQLSERERFIDFLTKGIKH